jgi:TRAP-type C4-dicarboxylate transport system substrate-binding protein
VQIADDAFYQGTVPIAGLSSLPFLLRSQAEMPKVMEILWPLVERDYAKNGVTVLGYYAYPEQVFWFRGNVSSLADIVGKKVRITSPEQGGMVRAFGGMPVQIGSAEVPAALERGVVDGILTASAGGIMAWKELLKSSYTMGLNYPVSFVVVNTERFKKLPPALQTKVRDIVRDNTRELTTELQREDGELRKKFSTEGISLHTPKPAEMAAAAAQSQQIWKTWADARGAEGVQTLERVRKVLGR